MCNPILKLFMAPMALFHISSGNVFVEFEMGSLVKQISLETRDGPFFPFFFFTIDWIN